jgi:hypothetical protein
MSSLKDQFVVPQYVCTFTVPSGEAGYKKHNNYRNMHIIYVYMDTNILVCVQIPLH